MRFFLVLTFLFTSVTFIHAQKANQKDSCVLKHWFLDQDADGYYKKDTIACEPKGRYWKLSANLGGDPNDKDPFYPDRYHFLYNVKKLLSDSGGEFYDYRGHLFSKDSIWVRFMDRKFAFDKVALIDNLPLPYVVGDSLYVSVNMPFKDPIIEYVASNGMIYSYDSVQITSYPFTQNALYEEYNLDNLLPAYSDYYQLSRPKNEFLTEISEISGKPLRELIFSDSFYFSLWGLLYEYPQLRNNVEVLKILNPPTRKRTSGIPRNVDAKEFLIEVVSQTEDDFKEKSGTAYGEGTKVKRRQLKKSGLELYPIPRDIAEELEDRAYTDFASFEKALWHFIQQNKRYRSVITPEKFLIKYVTPLYQTQDPYDVDNIIFVTEEYYLNHLEPVSKMEIW
ncbi:MAG: hypothetical protein RIC35_11270 [Marinoscillum sp.]